MKLKVLALILLALSQTHCDSRHVPSKPSGEAAASDWNKRFWFDKAKRTLLLGADALTADEEKKLLALSKSEIVDALMAKPEFYNTVLDFNMYFLGRRIENLVDAQGLVEAGSSSASAVNSAVELSRDGDYFALFQWSQNYSSIQDINFSSIVREGVPSSLALKSAKDFRGYWIDQAIKDVKRIRTLASQTGGLSRACELLNNTNRRDLYTNSLFNAALPENLIRLMNVNFNVLTRCGSLGIPFELDSSFQAALNKELSALENNLAVLPKVLAELPKAPAKSVKDLFVVSYDQLSPDSTILEKAFDDRLWAELPNFSTNYNRRRSAYVLKTYFCDDLTPLNIVAVSPSSHSQNKHASDTSCAACHYKLDPMAGFFRSRGIFGTDFDDKQNFNALVHDDFALRDGNDLKTYEEEWRAPAGSARAWNVGYIRSATNEGLNSYGETLDDLFAIIRASRESKVCLTKRMAEYVLGSEQVYDGAWIDSLALEFHKAAGSDAARGASSQAFKKSLQELCPVGVLQQNRCRSRAVL